MNPARLISLNQRNGSLRQILNVKPTVETYIGRQEGCKIRIPSKAVSRKHCRLAFVSEVLTAEDLGSSNGTYVNEVRITEQIYLKPGDVLRVGPFRFLVHYQLSDAAVKHLLEYLTGAPAADIDVEVVDSGVVACDHDAPVAGDDEAPTAMPGAPLRSPPHSK